MAKLQWCPNIADIDEATKILTAKFRTLVYEQAYIELDNGKIARLQGDSTGIFIPHQVRIILANSKMIHNHPLSKTLSEKEDKGLSGMDIGFAATTNLKSVAVLDEDIGIRLTRPKNGWAKIPPRFIFMANNTLWSLFGEQEIWNLE